MAGLVEIVEEAKGKDLKLKRRTVSILPVKEYSVKEIQDIRKRTGLSQKLFASYIGVSAKTVEAWETGDKPPVWGCKPYSEHDGNR